MPDTIERTIYKLEIDDSGYIRGVESLAASTKKFTDQQEAANKVLQTNEALLKNRTASVAARQKDLDSFNASQEKASVTVRAANEKHLQQLQKSLQLAQAEEQKLTDKVIQSKKAYEEAAKAAQTFANTTARAANLQTQTTGGKIPTGPPPPAVAANITQGISSQIAGVLNVAEFTEQAQIIEKTKNEFDDLAVSIGLAEARMQQLNATDEEFQQLEPIVKKGKEALQQYDKATQGVEKSTGTFKSQITKGREELTKLFEAGKGATKQYIDLEIKTAKLTDAFADQQARIKILASDTKLLDFGKGAITAATSAFSAYTSISILAGDESEELQKKTMQLFAAMQLLQSLEQLSNLTRREGVLATLGMSAAQSAYTAIVGASTGALKVFKLALIGTGIGAAIVLIGYLVTKWSEYRDTVKKAGEQQKLLNDIVSEGNKESGQQIADLKILTKAAQDSNLSMAERLKAVQQLQKEFPDYFGNLTKEKILTGDITKETNALTESIKAAGRARAAKGKIDAIEAQRLDLDFDKQKVIDERDEQNRKAKDKIIQSQGGGALTGSAGGAAFSREAQIRTNNVRAADKLADIKDKDDALLRQEDFLTKFVGLDELVKTTIDPTKTDKTKTDKAKADLQSSFEKRKADLLEQIAKLAETEFQSEVTIRQTYKVKLDKAIADINKDKSLKPGERKELITLTTELNTSELTKALDDFKKKITDARQKLNDELNNLQDKNITDSLNLLQDEFDRRAKLIQFNQEKEIVDTITANQKRLENFEESSKLIYGADFENNKNYLDRKAILVAEGEQLITNIVLEAQQKNAALSADIFQDLLGVYDSAIDNANLIRDEDLARQLKEAKENFLTRKISYQQFLDEVKKLKDKHDRDMREGDLVVLRGQLAELDRKIAATEDKTTRHYAELLKKQAEFRKNIAKKEQEVATDIPPPPEGDTGIERFVKYAENIGALANSIVGFWQAANQAEAEALDRSIALQERRVDAAQRIAERGNAQYLKAEEDRLTELNIKRENAARKQLGIDAALQASQILVGITGAISKIAAVPFGAETIANIAIIIGALATGYGLVKSLQGNQPKLFKGTPELKREGYPAGRDTIPAWLNEGEAVIPTEKNKKYKKSVEAIYHGKVPADVLNEFVENYVRSNSTKNYKTDVENKTETTYQKFVNNISKIPTKVLNTFISNYEKKERKYFKGTTSVKADNAGRVLLPDWFNRSTNISPKDRKVKKVVEAISNGNVSLNEVKSFAENYVVNKTFTDKKSLESKNLFSIIKQVLQEDKNISISDKQIKSFINDYRNKKTTDIIQTVFKEVNEKVDSNILETVVKLTNEKAQKNNISLDFQRSLVSKNVTIDEVKKYVGIINRIEHENKIQDVVNKAYKVQRDISEINTIIENKKIPGVSPERTTNQVAFEHSPRTVANLNKIDEDKNTSISENVTKYKNFVQNVTKVPGKVLNNFIENYSQINTEKISENVIKNFIENYEKETGTKVTEKVLNNFINNYEERKFFKGTTDLQGKSGIDKIPIWATQHEAIIPAAQNNLYKPVVNAVFKGTIPPEHLNNFVNNYHTVKPVPQPNYERIKDAAELKINSDGKMVVAISEQNKLIQENNDLQRQTLRAMKNMSVSANIDRDGVAIMVNEYIAQMEIDKRV